VLLQLEQVLSSKEVENILALLAGEQLVGGSRTALGSAAAVKRNLEFDRDAAGTHAAALAIVDHLTNHPLFELAVQPRSFSDPIFSRYEPGMEYGFHLDAAIMRRTSPVRADVAVTVFLSDPQSYDGGELVIRTSFGEFRYKGNVGDCVVYPASTFHRVNRVAQGIRTVAILWVQSSIRDPAKRHILYDLGCTMQYLDLFAGENPDADKLRRCYLNLVRCWAEV
jgi:PKHD-type hydroxylase